MNYVHPGHLFMASYGWNYALSRREIDQEVAQDTNQLILATPREKFLVPECEFFRMLVSLSGLTSFFKKWIYSEILYLFPRKLKERAKPLHKLVNPEQLPKIGKNSTLRLRNLEFFTRGAPLGFTRYAEYSGRHLWASFGLLFTFIVHYSLRSSKTDYKWAKKALEPRAFNCKAWFRLRSGMRA